MPFYSLETPTLCDDLFQQGIVVPKNRRDGVYSKLIKDIGEYGPFLLQYFKTCYEPVRRLRCQYYLPTCGNVTVFKPPSAVCPDLCHSISQLCPDEWSNFLQDIATYEFILQVEGLQLIDCDYPGLPLSPLPHCCHNHGIDIGKLSSYVSCKIDSARNKHCSVQRLLVFNMDYFDYNTALLYREF